MRSKTITSILVLITFLPLSSLAGIEKLIKNVMPSGTMSNVSRSAVINDQLAGHAIGGSVLLKTPPVEAFQPVNFQAPSCRLGGLPCGAQLDLRGGAFSFINKPAMEKFLKDTAQVGIYTFLLAIKSMSPQIENIMTYLEQVQRSMNQFNINSCEIGTKIAGGFMNSATKGAELTRQSALVMGGGGSDMADIRDKANKDTPDPTMGNKELQSLVGDNFNLVWKALDKKAENNDNAKSLKELLMSISGTIIGIKDNDGRRSFIHKVSLVNKELIEEFIGVRAGDANVELYVCDETDRCLAPQKIKTNLSAKDTLYGSIDDILVSLVKKIKLNEGTFTEEEENLIALSSVPLINKIQMELATRADSAYLTVRMAEFVEALCYDVVTNHLTKLLHQVSEAVTELSYVQIANTGVFGKFEAEVHKTIHF